MTQPALSPAGAGLYQPLLPYPGLADSPWAKSCRPLTRACVVRSGVPRARGLALGYTLSPAGAGLRRSLYRTQGSRTRPGLHALARWRGLVTARAPFSELTKIHNINFI